MSDKPKGKPYESTPSGIRVKSGRKIGEVRIPNYVYDLWLPLIGGDALAVYGVYCRLERQRIVKAITLKDIAKACRIGDRKLREINKTLVECGFIFMKKPTGLARANHFTTEITTLNPPRHVIDKLIEKHKPASGYTPLSAWLIDSEAPNDYPNEKPNDFSAEKPNDTSDGKAIQRLEEAPNDAPILLQPSIVATLDIATSKEGSPLPPAYADVIDEISDRRAVQPIDNDTVAQMQGSVVIRTYEAMHRGYSVPQTVTPSRQNNRIAAEIGKVYSLDEIRGVLREALEVGKIIPFNFLQEKLGQARLKVNAPATVRGAGIPQANASAPPAKAPYVEDIDPDSVFAAEVKRA